MLCAMNIIIRISLFFILTASVDDLKKIMFVVSLFMLGIFFCIIIYNNIDWARFSEHADANPKWRALADEMESGKTAVIQDRISRGITSRWVRVMDLRWTVKTHEAQLTTLEDFTCIHAASVPQTFDQMYYESYFGTQTRWTTVVITDTLLNALRNLN